MASLTIDVDLPPGVKITSYSRFEDGHGIEVDWPLPERCQCEKCGHEQTAQIEFKTTPQVIRDLNIWDQPSFWIDQAPFHRCGRCNYRQHIIPPFKRKDVSYTYRFEQFVLRSLIGSSAEEVARRLGISAETVERIVEYQLVVDRQIDPNRVITDIGLDELSLKKRHRLYVTLMTDLSDPARPQILCGGAWQGRRGGPEVPGPTHEETTSADSDPPGRHGAGLSGGVRPTARQEPPGDRSIPCGQEVQRPG
jgi:transposase